MPTKEHLQLFARQLASWAEQIIENGRTPFRRVDLFHPLHTAEGPCRPPLVFWINRQSQIAGGLIFLPDSTTDRRLTREAAAAAALGLRHFVTWEAETINIWETESGQNRLVTAMPLATAKDPAAFHYRLYELIDQLKLFSVTGRIAAEDCSPYYLLNLLTETLSLTEPGLIEACRRQRSENPSILTCEEEAESWNRLILIRLLCLLKSNLVPANLPADRLAEMTADLLAQLPEPLAHPLQVLKPEPTSELPAISAIAFHHLVLRLQQLGWQGQDSRADETLRLLLTLWNGPPQADIFPQDKERLLFHSQELAPRCRREISQSGAQLAANALWRALTQQKPAEQLQGDSFKFSATLQDKSIRADFYSNLRPDHALRRELSAHLRSSWPNRKLSIPGNLPFWVTEAIHLLGLIAHENRVELSLPATWLNLTNDSVFCELLFSNFTLESVDCRDPDRHLLILFRQQQEALTQCLILDGSRRSLELGREPALAANRLRYALNLSPVFFELFMEQQLVQLSVSAEELAYPESLCRYAKSRTGQALWQLRTRNQLPAETSQLLQEGAALGWLVPEAALLKEFSRQKTTCDSLGYDLLLAQLFNIPASSAACQLQTEDNREFSAKPINRTLFDDLLRQLEIEGIPHFPKTYLYRQETGPLSNYRFTPPLRIRHELLGEYVLEDLDGQRFQIFGEETKEALMLASNLELTSLEIPDDRQKTAEMLKSYREDLFKLRERIGQLCHQHIEQPQAVIRLQKKFWKQLRLPPQKWLSD